METYNENFPENLEEEEILDAEITEQEEYSDDVITGVIDDSYDELDDFDDFDLSDDIDDDKINKVLDELAELKRNLSSSNARGIYQNQSAPTTPGEVALYNEINRLRDELSKLQQSQTLQAEINKIKEAMEKENKQQEEKLMSEIRGMKKGKEEIPTPVAVVAPSPEKKEIEQDVKGYAEIMTELAEIKKALLSVSQSKEKTDTPCVKRGVAKLHKWRTSNENPEILRRLVEIKLTLGKLPLSEYEKELKLLGLYDTLSATKSAVYSKSCGMAEKLDMMRKLESELSAIDDCYVLDVVDAYNGLVDYILSSQLTIDGVEVFAKLPVSAKIKSTLKGDVLTIAVEFINATILAKDKKTGVAVDKLPLIVDLKNKLQSGKKAVENDVLYNDLIRLGSELVFLTDESELRRCSEEMAVALEQLCYLAYGEFVTFPKLVHDKAGLSPRSVVRDFIEEVTSSEEVKTDDATVSALTNAVNLLRAEIANGAVTTSAGGELRRLIEETESARADREKLLDSVEHIKNALDAFVGDEVSIDPDNDDINQLLQEVKTLHTEMNTLSENESAQKMSVSTPDEVNLFLSEIVSLRDEVQSYKDEVTGIINSLAEVKGDDANADGIADAPSSAVYDELVAIRADIASFAENINANAVATEDADKPVIVSAPVVSKAEIPDSIIEDIAEIKRVVASMSDSSVGVKIDELRDELAETLGNIDLHSTESVKVTEDARLTELLEAVSAIQNQIADINLMPSEDSRINELIEAVAGVRKQIDELDLTVVVPENLSEDKQSGVETELIVNEIKELKNDLSALKSDISALKAQINVPDNSHIESVIADIYEDVRAIREEPDYGVMNEILALREEFQLMKERLEKKEKETASTDKIVAEIQSLREQIFAINMAAVSDGEEQNYESYNNIIVDELSAVREELASLLSIGTDGIRVDTSTITAKLDEVRDLMTEAREAADAHKKATEADEVVQLKQTIAEQKETQALMLDLMNKMVAKLDKQVETSEKMSEEIASKLGEKGADEEVRHELENIKYTLGVMQGKEDGNADADLEDSIDKLKSELSKMAGLMDGINAEKPKSYKNNK
ncbi:MAG: hypothetical protein IKM44_00930 [Clostridia bacterium]|nr:hypothetical protein [Clostridia bacterium]